MSTRAAELVDIDSSDLNRDALEFHRAFSDLARVLQFRDRDCICCYDLSVTQAGAVEVLVEQGPLTLNELAAELYLDKSTASRVVATLERKRFVKRNTHPDDRRAVHLVATPSGRRIHERIERDMLAEQKRLLSEFNPTVRRQMAQLLQRLAKAAACRVDTSGGQCCRVE